MTTETTDSRSTAPGENDGWLPPWRVKAHNDARDSRNPMHDDTIARRLGFGGGLVPGVTLYGYLTRPLVSFLGAGFLECGELQVRFRQPVYEGEEVTARVRRRTDPAGGQAYDLTLDNAAGEPCVIGTARDTPAEEAPLTIPPAIPLPASRRPATPEELRARPQLGTWHTCLAAAEGARFAALLGDDLPLYREFAHPSWLLRQANLLIDQNLAVGPWIHVASEIRHCGLVRLDEPLAVHGEVVELFERKGNDYLDVDVVYVTSRPVLRVRHRAIYRLGAAG